MASWRWTIQGTEERLSPAAVERGHDATGVIEAECAGEVVEWFAQHGHWDCIDQDEAVTLIVEPQVSYNPKGAENDG